MPGAQFPIIITTYAGLEKGLAEELQDLGTQDVLVGRRMVSIYGDMETLYRINYRSRLGLRVLRQLAVFNLTDQNSYYEALSSIPWESWIARDQSIAIDAVVSGKILTHSQFAAQRAKDAIVDRLRNLQGWRPGVDLTRPDVRIHVHVNQESCHVSLDSSSEPLHKRGYRKAQGDAPLSEVMAAGLIHLSNWSGDGEFLDPMCGSGTIAIEAAMKALNYPAAYFRRFFGFQRWPDFEQKTWDRIKEEGLESRIIADPFIRASDASYKAVANASLNIAQAGFSDLIKLEKKPFQAVFPRRLNGTIITNPPYNERIKSQYNIELYKSFGDILKTRFKGYTAWIFSGDMEALSRIGLRTSARIPLFNGPIECRLARFDLFQGTLVAHKYGDASDEKVKERVLRKRRGHGNAGEGNKEETDNFATHDD